MKYFVFSSLFLILVNACQQENMVIPDTGRKIVINGLKSLLINDIYLLRPWHIIDDSLFFGYISNRTGKVEYKVIIPGKMYTQSGVKCTI
jgi:hypothetical protein